MNSFSDDIELEVVEGTPKYMGVTQSALGLNFAVYAPDLRQLFILFFKPDTEELVAKIELPFRTGNIFHGVVKGVDNTWTYAIQGTQQDTLKGELIDKKLFIDPYAKNLNRPVVWEPNLYHDNSPFFIPKAKLVTNDFDWQGVTKPQIKKSQTILYETHIKGFTKLMASVPDELAGTYLGLAEPQVIEYIKSLGVTSVQLMPVFSFMSEPRLTDLRLTNYWGYNPINFFCPDPRYAIDDAVTEFKTLVRELHKAGLEVILDVVYNHTAEAGPDGPALSFRGLAEFDFYLRTEADYRYEYANFTGCGNTVNTDGDYGFKLIMDSLRYWITEMQVDGFRFDLAATLGRNGERFNRRATLFRAMAQDPIISKAKLIAEPWDIGPEGYQLGNFPSNWVECNDRYRDGMRKFWRGDLGLASETASRLLGSRDIFSKGKRSQVSSVNYICYHDGYTLRDLVSYEQKHNLANLENNRDGHGANYSRNYGAEGETTNPDIVTIRALQQRNFFATVLFSQGIPHILAGDEISRTQQGNNNAYCQDNELNWLDWQLTSPKQELLEFVKYCIQLRKTQPLLQQCFLQDDKYKDNGAVHSARWLRPDGEEKQLDDWHNHLNQCLALLVIDENKQYQVMLILNAADEAQDYVLPQGLNKQLLVDTSLPKLLDSLRYSQSTYKQKAHSLSLWRMDTLPTKINKTEQDKDD